MDEDPEDEVLQDLAQREREGVVGGNHGPDEPREPGRHHERTEEVRRPATPGDQAAEGERPADQEREDSGHQGRLLVLAREDESEGAETRQQRDRPQGGPEEAHSDLVKQGEQRCARQLGLRHEPTRTAFLDKGAEVRAVTTRSEDHRRRGAVQLSKPRSDLEAVEVGKLNVKKDDLRVERRGGLESTRSVLCLTHHVEPLGLEEDARSGAKARMVVDDQHTHGHVPKCGSDLQFRNTASHTVCKRERSRFAHVSRRFLSQSPFRTA